MKKWKKLGMSIGVALLLGQVVAPVSHFLAEEKTAWNQANMSQVDQLVKSWSENMGQHYSRFYPNAATDADKQQLKKMVDGLQLDGANFDYGLADEKPNAEYLIEYVYSTFGKGERVITYYFVNHKGKALVLVNDSSAGRAVNQVWQTQNQDLSTAFDDFASKSNWQTTTVKGKVEWTKEKLQELDKFMVQWKGHAGMDFHQVYPDTSVPHHEYIARHFFDVHRTLLDGKWHTIGYTSTGELTHDITFVAVYSNYFEGIRFLPDNFRSLFFGYLADKTPVVLQWAATDGDVKMRRTEYTDVSDKFVELAKQPVSASDTPATTNTANTDATQIVAEIQANPIETIKKLFPLRDKQFSEADGQAYMKKTLWAGTVAPGIKRYPSFTKLKDGYYEGGESTGGPAVAIDFFKVGDVIIGTGNYGHIEVYDLKQDKEIHHSQQERRVIQELQDVLYHLD